LPELSQPPAETIEEIVIERQRLSAEIEAYVELGEALDERQRMHLIDRSRVVGESAAVRWLIENSGETE
jgi:hypothetical protein